MKNAFYNTKNSSDGKNNEVESFVADTITYEERFGTGIRFFDDIETAVAISG